MTLVRCAICGELYSDRKTSCPECTCTEIDEEDVDMDEGILSDQELRDLAMSDDIDKELSGKLSGELLDEVGHGKEN